MDNKLKATVMIGRFQPFHRGHKEIARIAMTLKPTNQLVIAIIKRDGKNISNTSPWSSKWMKQMIKRMVPEAIVIEVENAFIMNVLPDGLELDAIVCGPDRKSSYERMIGKSAPEVALLNIPEIYKIRGTLVRQAIDEGDVKEFQRMMPLNADLRMWKSMQYEDLED